MGSEIAATELKQMQATLRQVMKLKGLNYSDLARAIGVSEVTIKRVFASNDLSIARLLEICKALGLAFSDLVLQSQEQSESVFTLSRAQEQFFADHPHYYAFFMEILDAGTPLSQISKRFKLSMASIRKYLRKLEELKILDRLDGDNFRLRVSGTLNWLNQGPLQKKFLESDNQDFVRYLGVNFELDQHFLSTADRRVHPDTYEALLADMKSLVSQYRKRAYRDQQYFPKDELMKVKWIMGSAPFERSWRDSLRDI